MGVYKRFYPVFRILFGLTIIVSQVVGITSKTFAASPSVAPACDIVSDDFYPETTLGSEWTFEDGGDSSSSYNLTGTNAEISVTGGSSHQFWANEFDAPRLVQNISDTDFGVEIKFDSVPSATYQEQGIVVFEDNDTMLRFETFSQSGTIHVFAAFINDSSTSHVTNTTVSAMQPYLRVVRSGDVWTFSYSTDGSTWNTATSFTQAITATKVGFYAGNAGGSAPAYTASAAYFANLDPDCYANDDINGPPDVTNPGNQNSDEGDSVSLQIVASDPEDDALEYSAINLPPGLSINSSTGEITGTVDNGASGTYNVEVTVSDGVNDTTVDFTWTIGVFVCSPISDDFYPETTANSAWTFVDPDGDSTLTMTGTNAEISVPSGSAHEFWTSIKNAPHLIQNIADEDFAVEVKFESVPNTKYQEQGIVVKEDADTMMRIETYSNGSSIYVLVAYLDGSTSDLKLNTTVAALPPYLRLVRSGDSWVYYSSLDGSSWSEVYSFTQVIEANYVGFYAGTAGDNPAFTASADYFLNLDSRCVLEDTDTPAATPPTIDLWYGDSQDFGDQGTPQQWINVLGRVEDANGVSSLTYSLNSAAPVSLPLGPDGKRLVGTNDFNIEIDHADLLSGANTIEFVTTDTLGASTTESMTLNYQDGNVWPLPYTADWSSGITEAGQIVDGLWEQVAGGVRTVETGYDRLIAIGDETWETDYEVTVPVTIHSWSGGSGVGFAVGWQGHTGSGNPRTQWPLQAIGWLRNFPSDTELRILTYPGTVQTSVDRHDVTAETTYLLKMRSTYMGSDISRVKVKLWEDGESEPTAWDLTADVATRDGSVLLIAHKADVTFGDVEIDELGDALEVGELSLDLEVDELITQFTVEFSDKVFDPAGDDDEDDVTNPDNYILFGPGVNTVFDTSTCTDATPPDHVLPDDEEVVVNSVAYDETTMTATVQVNDGNSLPIGNYRLLVCGSTSIVDLAGNPINNGLDYLYDFSVVSPASGGGGGGGGHGRGGSGADGEDVEDLGKFALPFTGFTPGVVTALPSQPAEKAYDEYEGIWLEIPKLDVSAQIVGIPLLEDGWDVTWLGSQVGYLYGTAFPTWEGNTVITAHVWDANNNPGPFAHLKDMQYGDEFYIYSFGQKFVYQVRKVDTVKPYLTYSVMQHEDLDWVTLMTCESYNGLTDSYQARRVVRAVLVAVE